MGVSTRTSDHAQRPQHRARIVTGSVIGLLTAGAALGAGELTAGLWGTSAPVVAVGDAIVDHSPTVLKEFAITVFGIYDKVVLVCGVVATVFLVAALAGVVALRRPAVGYAVLVLFAAVGSLAVLVRRTGEPLAAVPVLVAAAAGAVALFLLLRGAPQPVAIAPEPVDDPVTTGGESDLAAEEDAPDKHTGAGAPDSQPPTEGASRRGFLLTGAGVLTLAMAATAAGRYLGAGADAQAARASLRLPAPAEPLPSLPSGVDLNVPGLTPFTSPTTDFYRIDTALTVPRVAPQEWRLRVHGMVDEEIELSYDELLRRPLIESDTTLTCVSNEVGGDLVDNTRWLGVRLADVLRRAGVRSGADQVLSTSTDGWTCGTPTEAVMDGRDALLAIAMDGEPLPFQHGFPVRMVVPGLYGFVSATKWVTDIKLTRFADESAYWAQRGWAVKAPIKTMSRIDVPGPLEEVPAGPVTLAGVAWAQRRGIDAVEVRVDGGDWGKAQLAEVPGIDTWRQWTRTVDVDAGRHTFEVRATDSSGNAQPEQRAEPIPNGASGWHSVQITAE